MSNMRTQYAGNLFTDNEPARIYETLAKSDLDVTFRIEFLKPYRRTDEGLRVLMSALSYAKQMEQHAISKVKQDPTIALVMMIIKRKQKYQNA